MLIDWFTVIAQVINFLILVWLLKRFLYKPVLRAIEEREKKIAIQLKEAAAQKAEAQKEEENFLRMNQELQQKREHLMSDAEKEANNLRNQLLSEARKEYADLRSDMQETLQKEQEKLTGEIAERTRSEVFAIGKKLFADLADASFEEKITGVFIERLKEMKEEDKQKLQQAMASSHPPGVIVQSGYEIPATREKAIESVIHKLVNGDCRVSFRSDPEKVNGIELVADGYKITWSVKDYFASLEKSWAKDSSTLSAGTTGTDTEKNSRYAG